MILVFCFVFLIRFLKFDFGQIEDICCLAHSSCVINSKKVLTVSTQTNVVYCLQLVTFVEQNTRNKGPRCRHSTKGMLPLV